jgi:hypothetical protein
MKINFMYNLVLKCNDGHIGKFLILFARVQKFQNSFTEIVGGMAKW